MPRYVILRHEPPADSARATHWDLMLETDGELRTWALAVEPRPHEAIEALALAPHRLAYLDYEGPVSGDRGAVVRWDAGEFSQIEVSDRSWVADLAGRRLRGRATMTHDPAEDVQRWTFWFVPAEGA